MGGNSKDFLKIQDVFNEIEGGTKERLECRSIANNITLRGWYATFISEKTAHNSVRWNIFRTPVFLT